MKATEYYLNVNYVCNERCVFCAADVHVGNHNSRVRRAVTLDEVRSWMAKPGPRRHDRVSLAGGEPTLHPELLNVVRLLAKRRPEVVLFTNGLRLADPGFARATAEAGVTCYQIAFFGASAAAHDGITGLPGSFEKTITALKTLAPLRRELGIQVVIRLLVSRQSYAENQNIVSVIAQRAPEVDGFSLNRLILSKSAEESEAAVSWKEARISINLAARRVLQLGYKLQLMTIPFCLFDSDNAEYLARELEMRKGRIARGEEPAYWSLRYLDPQHSGAEGKGCAARPALPDVCFRCTYLSSCSRVEPWYLRRFGTEGLVSAGSKTTDR
jgi:MoaA/NifB/PqqE/SkfB family radical SAM enzyme